MHVRALYIFVVFAFGKTQGRTFIVAGRIIGSFVGNVSRVKLTSDYGS